MGARSLIPASRSEALRRFAWRLETPRGLVALFGAALALRLLIAPFTGFWGDIEVYRQWAVSLHAVGLHRFYTEGTPAEYPPGYLYVLWLIGKLSASPGYLLLKLPSLLADLGLAWIAGTFAARLAPSTVTTRWPVRALVAAGVLFNPAVLALGTVWGQVDSVNVMLVVWSLLLLFAAPPMLRYEIPAFVLYAVAISTKPQSAFVFPVMMYALYRRYLYHRNLSEAIDGALRDRADRCRLPRHLVDLRPAVRTRPRLARPLQRHLGREPLDHERERLQPVGRGRFLEERLGRARTS